MTRLAFMSPLPPASSGIADYSVDVLNLLAADHQIDVFHDQAEVTSERLAPGCRLAPAKSFLSAHAERPYELVIYQLGNADCHGFLYDLMARVPGLLVLHDLVLHHSRARMFLDSAPVRAYRADPSSATARAEAEAEIQAYRSEIAYTYPGAAGRLDQTHLSTTGDLLPYAYPLFRIPVECSRATAAHNDFMVAAVRAEVPGRQVFRIPMAIEPVTVPDEVVAQLRARHGIAPGELVVGSFGLATREKRLETVARAVARARALHSRIRLLVVGQVPDPVRLGRLIAELGLTQSTTIAGRVSFHELAAHITLADVAVHLRYPTGRETSAALLRILAQARPPVISDLEHLADIPEDAVVRADVTDEEGEVTRAILNLAASPERRRRLGRRAREHVERNHSGTRCLAGYEGAIEGALQLPSPPAREWPARWLGR